VGATLQDAFTLLSMDLWRSLPTDLVLLLCRRLSLLEQVALSGVCVLLRNLLHRTVLSGWSELLAGSHETARARRARPKTTGPSLAACCIRCIGGSQCGKTTTIIVYTTNAVPHESWILSVCKEYTVNVMVDECVVHATICDSPSNVDVAELTKWENTDVFMAFCDRTRASSAREMKQLQCLARAMQLSFVW
jgi:hypothetical protein